MDLLCHFPTAAMTVSRGYFPVIDLPSTLSLCSIQLSAMYAMMSECWLIEGMYV